MRKKSLASIFFICFFSCLHAQDPKLLEELKRSKEDTNKVHLLWDVGVSVIYQQPLEAIPYFKQGIELSRKLNFEPGLEKCNAATSTAFAFNAQFDSCLHYINTAIYYANRIGDVNRQALVYLNRADVYNNIHDYSTALKDCDTAMKYAELSGNKDRLARIYNIISDIYEGQLKYDLAKSYIEKASALYIEIGNPQMTAQSYFDISSLYRQTGDLEKGIQYLQKAIHIADSIKDIRNLSSFTGDLAVLMLEKKNYKEAESLANKALEYARQTGNKKQEAVVHSVFYHIYFKQDKFDKAIASGLAGFNILREFRDIDREKDIAGSLAEAYFKTGNTAEAYNFLKINRDLNDSVLRKRFSDETAKLQTSFELSQKDKEIQLLSKDKQLQAKEISRQRVLFIGSAVLVVLSLIGLSLFISRYRLRQRMKEMQLRNQIAADLHDEVGSSLSSIHMLSEMATAQHDGSQKEIMHKVSNYTRETMDKMGDIVWMIKPAVNDGPGLRERMERFVFEMCNSRNIKCQFEGEDIEKLKMNMQQRKAFYLVFKEAVNNAVKYSDARSLEVLIRNEGNNVRLVVKDDGKGFDPIKVKKGNGLENMYNRAKEMGGQLNIESGTGSGTLVTLVIPV